MSSVDPFVPGGTLLTYRLSERVGTTAVWRGEDTRTGKKVAIKVLSKQLPRDPAKREALLRDVRIGGALFHTSLVNIVEIAPAGDALVLVMEWFDGQPASAFFRNKPAERPVFFRIAYQIADVLKLLQAKNLIHGNIAGDSVLVTDDGHVRLGGLNVTNLLSKRESPSFYQQKGSDVRAVAYMSPEQIKGDPLTTQSDIFSLGMVLYEVATGRLPYAASNAGELSQKIVNERLTSPKSINPNIDNAVLGVLGKCLFPDPFKREKDGKSLIDDINRVEPDAAKFVADVAKAAITGVAPRTANTRSSLLFVADIANFDQLSANDPATAQRQVARMQQVLGEAVFLFDGQIVDPFGSRLIAELPSVESALEAARKGEFDFSLEQQGSGFIPVRLLLHAGDVETRDGKVVGAAVDKAVELLQHVEPLQLFVSEEFAKKGRGNVRLRDAGARAGVKLYSIQPTEPPKPRIDTAAIEAAERQAFEEEAAAAAAAAAKAARRKKTLLFGGLAAALLVVALIGGYLYLMTRPRCCGDGAAPVAAVPSGPPPASAAHPRKVLVQPFTVETPDPNVQLRAEAARLAAIEILRGYPEVRLVDAPGADVASFTATIRGDAAAPQLVPASGAPVALADASSGIQSIVGWVSRELRVSHPMGGTPDAYNALADAASALNAKDDAKAETALRASIKADPNLLPAQLLAMRFFASKGKDADAVAAAKQVMALDPANTDAARTAARAGLKAADVGGALAAYALVLKNERADQEALNTIGRYAVAANDQGKVNAVVARLRGAGAVHAPDLLLSAGRIDNAVDQYYEVEQKSPSNAALALKIGRLAVLRRSNDIANTELKKLEQLHDEYALHVLKAYIAAEARTPAVATAELKAAEALSQPGDDFYTSAAEVAAINGDANAAVTALERAADRKEPMAGYILTNRLLAQLLASDPRYLKVREKFAAEQDEIRAALANVAL